MIEVEGEEKPMNLGKSNLQGFEIIDREGGPHNVSSVVATIIQMSGDYCSLI